MDAVQLLLDDHEKVRQLFRQFQSTGQGAQQEGVGQHILAELEAHSKIEEEIFYPAVRQQVNALQGIVTHSYEEHAEVDQLIAQLKTMQASDPAYTSTFQKMMQSVEHHVQEEETGMLPQAREALGGQTDALGDQMMLRKQQVLQQAMAQMGMV